MEYFEPPVENHVSVVPDPVEVSGPEMTQKDTRRELGLLCEPGSPASLADALRTFTERREAVHDVESAREYAREQSFEVFAESIYDAYSRLAGRRTNGELKTPEAL